MINILLVRRNFRLSKHLESIQSIKCNNSPQNPIRDLFYTLLFFSLYIVHVGIYMWVLAILTIIVIIYLWSKDGSTTITDANKTDVPAEMTAACRIFQISPDWEYNSETNSRRKYIPYSGGGCTVDSLYQKHPVYIPTPKQYVFGVVDAGHSIVQDDDEQRFVWEERCLEHLHPDFGYDQTARHPCPPLLCDLPTIDGHLVWDWDPWVTLEPGGKWTKTVSIGNLEEVGEHSCIHAARTIDDNWDTTVPYKVHEGRMKKTVSNFEECADRPIYVTNRAPYLGGGCKRDPVCTFITTQAVDPGNTLPTFMYQDYGWDVRTQSWQWRKGYFDHIGWEYSDEYNDGIPRWTKTVPFIGTDEDLCIQEARRADDTWYVDDDIVKYQIDNNEGDGTTTMTKIVYNEGDARKYSPYGPLCTNEHAYIKDTDGEWWDTCQVVYGNWWDYSVPLFDPDQPLHGDI